MNSLVLVSGILLVTLNVVWAASLSSVTARQEEECRRLGFERAEVKCQYCDPLMRHTSSTELLDECISCCTEEEQTPQRIYARARIGFRGVKYHIRMTESELGVFYQRYRDKFKGRLEFVDEPFVFTPRLVLMDDDGRDEMEINIVEWSKDTLHDFLMQAFGMQEAVQKK